MVPAVRKKTLKSCLSEMLAWVINDPADTEFTGIAWDSRHVKPGDAFFALVGQNFDGHQFVETAIDQGAAVVFGTRPAITMRVPYVQIKGDDHLALAKFSASFYDHPSKSLIMIGITGTDGKTTTCNLVYQILRAAGISAGLISTVNAVIGDEVLDTGFHVTTPESPDIQRYLARMVEAGLTHVVLEATSHGLAQGRVAEVDFDLAAITNVTHEHLDYHGTYKGYLQAKGLLFEALSGGASRNKGVEKIAILNKNDQSYGYLAKITQAKQLSYSLSSDSEINAQEIHHSPEGLSFLVNGPGKSFQVKSSLMGHYNVHNILAALGLTVFGLGIPVETAQQALKTVETVPGRMERVELGQDFLAIVDFAHTPNAIKQALVTARELTSGKLIAVFGSAGLRDIEKRKIMPEIAIKLADEIILTAEDPRTESLEGILRDMAEGASKGGGQESVDFWLEPDRGMAIRKAVQRAKTGDLVIICGKGHEQSMCFGHIEYKWDDRTALKAALSELLAVDGPQMPLLPTSQNKPNESS